MGLPSQLLSVNSDICSIIAKNSCPLEVRLATDLLNVNIEIGSIFSVIESIKQQLYKQDKTEDWNLKKWKKFSLKSLNA